MHKVDRNKNFYLREGLDDRLDYKYQGGPLTWCMQTTYNSTAERPDWVNEMVKVSGNEISNSKTKRGWDENVLWNNCIPCVEFCRSFDKILGTITAIDFNISRWYSRNEWEV